MFTKPDLLFIRDVTEIRSTQLELTIAKEITKKRDQEATAFRRARDLFYTTQHSDFLDALNSDLIHGFTPPVPTFTSKEFASDLSLELVVENFFVTEFTAKFQEHVLTHAPIDLATIRYRWEILDELTEQHSFLQGLRDLSHQLTVLYKESLQRHEEIDSLGLNLCLRTPETTVRFIERDYAILNGYVEAIKAISQGFESAHSRGLKQLRFYAQQILETEDFKELDQMIWKFNNAKYVELGVSSTGIGEIRRVKFLGEGKRQLRPHFLDTLNPLQFPRLVYNLDAKHHYNNLLAYAFEDFFDRMEEQILHTLHLVGDFEFYTGALNYHNILKRSGLPITRPNLIDKEERRHTITKMYPLLIPSSWHNTTCHDPYFYVKGDTLVGNSFTSNPQNNLFLITGANNGGKTRYTTNIGLCTNLAQSGLWIPALEMESSLVDNIFTHFVSGDDAGNSSGRWVGEIERIKKVLEQMTPYSLSLIDDFGSGTNYLEARGPALNVIYGHYRLGSTLVMNTHLHQLAEDAERGPFSGISNWQMEIQDGLRYTYTVVPGRAEKSYAADIAAKHGFSTAAIDTMIIRRTDQGELTPELVHPAFELKIE